MKREYAFNSQHQKEIFIFFTVPRLILVPSSLMSTWYRGSFLVCEADNLPLCSAKVKNALNYVPTPLYGFMVWSLIKHCTLPLRVYNCVGFLSVLVDAEPCGTESEDVVSGKLIPKKKQAAQWQSHGRINVIN